MHVFETRRSYWPLACCVATALLAYSLVVQASPERDLHDGAAAFARGDLLTAMTLYRRAAEAGSAPAQSRLAYLLDYSEDNEGAFRWYRQAAEQGHAQGQHGLAQMYAKGEGTEKDTALALSWFTHAAEQDYLPSVRVLAVAYETGELGLSINNDQALHWLRKGQQLADAWSIHRLARAYRLAELGLALDEKQANMLEASLVR